MKKIIILLTVAVHISFANGNSILFLGDSLTEGYGLQKQQAFPKIVENLIQTKLSKDIKVINGGVSGSTTTDALARLQWYLRKKPSLIFIAIGANDGLRGLNLTQSKKNLQKIIENALASNAKVIISGMLIPPNYGAKYTQEFKNMYEDLAKKYNLKMMPFLLDGVAGEKAMNQTDGIHPNEKGHILIAKNVFEFIKKDL